jgi:SSS family solute:Na+ symporter
VVHARHNLDRLVVADGLGAGLFRSVAHHVRFMAARAVKKMPTARNIAMAWMAVSLIGAIGFGVLGCAYTQRNGIVLEDPETLFILLAETLFPAIITGFLFAMSAIVIVSLVTEATGEFRPVATG